MELEIQNIGKQYNRQWLFKNVSFKLQDGQSMSITGKNGSGKSTLVQIVYGLVQASEGEVRIDGKNQYEPYTYFAASTPYMELPWEFSISEIHKLYKDLQKTNMELDVFLAFAEFSSQQSYKPVKLFSSGMQQRLKTALCMSSNAPVLLLDEPLTNMDKQGELWYKNCIDSLKSRICIIAGNNLAEYEWANFNLQIA